MNFNNFKPAHMLGGLLLALTGVSAVAQTWAPQKNVELVVYSAPGGSNDKTARSVERIVAGKKMIKSTMTVVNKTGGGGNIQLNYMTQHAGDPHYLMITTPTLLANHITGNSAQTYTDFTPIASMINDYVVYVVNADSPIKTGKDLIDRLKKNPKSVSIGFATTLGSHNHIAAGLLMKKIGGDPKELKVIAFKGASDAITTLMGGHIDLVTTAAGNVSGLVESGKLRVVAVAGNQRMGGVFADVPTWKEQGVDLVWSNWRAFMGPKGMTAAQVKTWQDVLSKVYASAEWKEDLKFNYWGDNFIVGEEFNKDLAEEYAIMKSALTDLGLVK
ncbi:MAG: tripartite tricarboxylate transporter substrate binding protein [Herminiimonas sp.]|uniref:tripartite tricarboxylate transporter substrate binding protein n=1 Tax=Herminiimonas sp. TaxID=1926289 RepID=UPI0027256DAA|nr:tripartite tricarboxylate transporter substrate binding protein [Herminiimonas sp.]MDO9420613.1 tripartite tricarboxylate transporter substrate binding protein [Herminiimonas sp.]